MQSNPCNLDGFAFLEFSGPDPSALHQQFKSMGFTLTRSHKTLAVFEYRQGDIVFLVNEEEGCQAHQHHRIHGSGPCAMGFRVKNAAHALAYVKDKGATPFFEAHANHHLPAIAAIGGSVIYFVDDDHALFQDEWNIIAHPPLPQGASLRYIDHLTHNVYRGNMDKWADFYINLFNFHEIRSFDIKGQLTGLLSRAMESPCGKIKIPLNESKDDKSQIEEFLHEYNGEGIQHIALYTDQIYFTVPFLKAQGVSFLDVPPTYYEMIEARIPWHQEPIEVLREHKILIDGGKTVKEGLLLQIFTENIFGPVFFEIIERRGNQGFGEGNFQALFEAIERFQIERGTL